MAQLDVNLPPEVYPLAWLPGRWRGTGTLAYPGIEPSEIVSELHFYSDGGPYLSYDARTWICSEDAGENQTAQTHGACDHLWHTESGFWRIPPGQVDDSGKARLDPPFEVEALIADPAGYVTVYVGEVVAPRMTVASDVMARTETGAEVAAARRLYGVVEGDLLWAWDIAAFGHPLGSYLAARLTRVMDGDV